MDPVGKSIAGLIRENKKKQKKSGNKNDNTDTPKRSTNLAAVTPAKRTPIHNTQQPFWYSPECKKLFGYDKSDDSIDVVDLLGERIDLLRKVHKHEHAYQLVIPTTDDHCSCVTSHQIFIIRQKALFLLSSCS